MNQRLKTILLLLAVALSANAQHALDSIKNMLLNAPVQEKIYLHLDNQCYFKGDTIWYKAYVVRADNLTYTDMSRILYVELVSPDGMVVERQNIIISPDGYSDGNFALQDSIYSGYYEVRAYTRWMLNFNHRQHRYNKQETWMFLNTELCADYYRVWDGLYSRVFPVYSKPEQAGDYDARRMYQRPKQRLQPPLHSVRCQHRSQQPGEGHRGKHHDAVLSGGQPVLLPVQPIQGMLLRQGAVCLSAGGVRHVFLL